MVLRLLAEKNTRPRLRERLCLKGLVKNKTGWDGC